MHHSTRRLAFSIEPLDQPRPDSQTIPACLLWSKPIDDCRDRHTLSLCRSESIEASSRGKEVVPREDDTCVDDGTVTYTTALSSHTLTDEERIWMGELRKCYRE